MIESQAPKSLREKLNDVIAQLPEGQVTLAQVLDMFGQEGLLLFCVFLTLPFLVPVSIPGVSTAFGAVIFLIGLSVTLDANPWLPPRLMQTAFPSDKLKAALEKGETWVKRIERISHPRLLKLATGSAMMRLNGLMLLLGAVLLMAPFGLVPFSNTLPGLAILFLAVGILQRDGGCILIGYATNLATIVYFAFLFVSGAVAMREAVRKILDLFS